MRAEVERVLAKAIDKVGALEVEIDLDVVQEVLDERLGMPFPVSRSDRSLEQFMAAARIVQNTVPVIETEQTASAD